MMDAQTGYYHKNTFKNIRSAINRHLNDTGRSIDTVRDKEFKPANQTLRCNSFNFHTDENGKEYVTRPHETQQKDFQGGVESKEAPKASER